MTQIRKYRNSRDRTGQCSDDGHGAEVLFKSLIDNLGANATPSNIEGQFEGVDLHAFKHYNFDVKARKRKSRKDDSAQDEFIWIEFKNVVGKEGWLYGKADYIAFERENDFVVVYRPDLVEASELLVDLGANVDKANKALYKGYQRKGRKDLIAMIKFNDIFLYTNHFILPKCKHM